MSMNPAAVALVAKELTEALEDLKVKENAEADAYDAYLKAQHRREKATQDARLKGEELMEVCK